MIQIEKLSKIYKGSSEYAVNNISLHIKRGDIFGLLGTNGAGKTTTFSMICGLFPPTHGNIYISGKSVRTELSGIKQNLGVVPQNIALYPTLTGKENLFFFGQMYGIKRKQLKEHIDECFKSFEMTKHADKKVKHYSGGMKRKINLIAGILHKPELILLDEPAVGIDAHSRSEIMEHLKHINRQGATIVYTSHYLEEAEKLCTEIAIIDEGKIIVNGQPTTLIKENACKNLEELFFKLTLKNNESV
jgi:ABC-2 type transport system ATP-binding protein